MVTNCIQYISVFTCTAPIFGKPQTVGVGVMWVFIVIIIILLIIIVVIVMVFLRRRRQQQALFNHARLNKSPKKSAVGALGVKFTERSNGSYVEIKKQKEKEEREMQTRGIIEDVDMV